MEDSRFQKELFEFSPPKKRRFSGFGRLFKSNDLVVRLSAERMVFILIASLMLMVVIYALGVERGKAPKKPMPRVLPTRPIAKAAPKDVERNDAVRAAS